MGSASKVPESFSGCDARDIRRAVLVLVADLCTIISQVLLSLGFSPFRRPRAGCMAHCGSERLWAAAALSSFRKTGVLKMNIGHGGFTEMTPHVTFTIAAKINV